MGGRGRCSSKIQGDRYDACVSDGSMEKLYGGGEGQVFKQCVQWLEADTDNLKVLGALAVGNFARSGAFLLLLYVRSCFCFMCVPASALCAFLLLLYEC